MIVRGYEHEHLVSIFKEAAQHIDRKEIMTEAERRKRKNNKELDKKMLIFHRQFHPRDIERRTIQKAFRKHMLKEDVEGNTENNEKREGIDTLGIERMTIAYSRQKNLRDLLCPSTLYQPKDKSVRDYFVELERKQNKNNSRPGVRNPYRKRNH